MATKKKTMAATTDDSAPPRDNVLPEALDQSFKDNTSLKVAYMAGQNFFFDERLAKSQFDSYQTIPNPYADPEPEKEEGSDETE